MRGVIWSVDANKVQESRGRAHTVESPTFEIIQAPETMEIRAKSSITYGTGESSDDPKVTCQELFLQLSKEEVKRLIQAAADRRWLPDGLARPGE